MTDEMDLVSSLKDAESPRPEAYTRARDVLRAAMADPGTVRVLKETSVQDNGFSGRRDRHRSIGTVGKVGIGAGIGVAAAAAAIALVATSGSTGTAAPTVAAGTGSGATTTAGASTKATAEGSAAAQSPLVTLAAKIKANYRPTGDASVVIQTQKIGNGAPLTEYFVYADNGSIYSAGSLSGLPAAVASGQTDGPDGIGCNIKAATAAATGNLASARVAMIDCSPNNLGLGTAAQQKAMAQSDEAANAIAAQVAKEKGISATPQPGNSPTAQETADNLLWINSYIAMTNDGAGNSAVREGVLRLLSTMPAVTVAATTTDGRATLTLTAGPEVFAGQGSQVVVIDAESGELISSVTNPGASFQSVTSYQVSRVSLSALKAGKF
jgi:hypothetical protein